MKKRSELLKGCLDALVNSTAPRGRMGKAEKRSLARGLFDFASTITVAVVVVPLILVDTVIGQVDDKKSKGGE